MFRVVQLLGGPELIPADQRFAGFPLPLVVHIVGASAFLIVGAFQLVPRFRRKHPGWHRRAGRVLAVAGLLVAGSAIWMTLFYAAKPGTGSLLYVLRLVFASAMAICLVLGVTAIRRGDVVAHRAWMIRPTRSAWPPVHRHSREGSAARSFGTGELQRDLAMGSAWVINLAVAEWVIRRRRGPVPSSRRPRPAGTRSAGAPS